MSASNGTATPVHDFISVSASRAGVWISVGFMSIAFTIRAYVRIACFRRLFVEDWLMLISLLMFITLSIIGTIYMKIFYDLAHLTDGSFVPGPEFARDVITALRAFAGTSVLTNLGIWLIKINFLIFFYRFGHQLHQFRILWWIVLGLVIACGIAQLGIIQFECMITDIDTLLNTCSTPSSAQKTHEIFIASVALDIFTDILIICFPITIFWSSRMTLRQKLMLSAVFSLVGFTIAVTIARGGFSINTEDPSAVAGLNVAFNFWIELEYLVSFLIACIISFRSLFIHNRNQTSLEAQRQAERLRVRTGNRSRGLRDRIRELHDSILETCKEHEEIDAEHEMYYLPLPVSGVMAVDFSTGDAASD